jgi:hypothetical protein
MGPHQASTKDDPNRPRPRSGSFSLQIDYEDDDDEDDELPTSAGLAK